MPSPFPGMDPYLERPNLWHEVHTDLIVAIRHYLAPKLKPYYRVAIQQRTFLTLADQGQNGSGGIVKTGIPDVLAVTSPQREALSATVTTVSPLLKPTPVTLPMPEEVTERYLEIRHLETNSVVTAIEILSHANKIGNEGRRQYNKKRLQVLGSLTHLVEIDLLRAGKPLPMSSTLPSDYRIIISRSDFRPQADSYLFGVRDPIPDIPIPLQRGESEPILPLNQLIHNLYDQGAYDIAIDYAKPPEPQLTSEDSVWSQELYEMRND